MDEFEPFVDIHCHLVPGIDDGARNWDDTLAMARMAAADGIGTIVVTPHQLGSYRQNSGDEIRRRTAELQKFLDERQVALRVLPGADVRIEADITSLLRSGEVLTLADRRKHVLLELPHEMYIPLEPLLAELEATGLVGILSHPERNLGLAADPRPMQRLVDAGCLMQVTAGSLLGAFGAEIQRLTESFLAAGLVHFVSTDAHGVKSRRPVLRRAFERVVELTNWETASDLCCRYPSLVAEGGEVAAGRRKAARGGFRSLWRWNKAA
jgi:protein-tyrosine phosphatase